MSLGESLLVLFAACVFTGVGAVLVVCLGSALRHWVMRRASLGKALAVSHAVIITAFIALSPTPFFPSGPYDDFYWAFMVVPGVHIDWLGVQFGGLFWPALQKTMSLHLASMMVIVVIPGMVGLLLGTLQWYCLGALWQRYRPMHFVLHKPEEKITNYQSKYMRRGE